MWHLITWPHMVGGVLSAIHPRLRWFAHQLGSSMNEPLKWGDTRSNSHWRGSHRTTVATGRSRGFTLSWKNHQLPATFSVNISLIFKIKRFPIQSNVQAAGVLSKIRAISKTQHRRSAIQLLWRPRQEDCEFKTSPSIQGDLISKNKTQKQELQKALHDSKHMANSTHVNTHEHRNMLL